MTRASLRQAQHYMKNFIAAFRFYSTENNFALIDERNFRDRNKQGKLVNYS